MNGQSQQICRDDDSFPIKQSFADSLFSWGKKFSEAASSLKSMDPLLGSLSYRYGLGFVMTSAKAHFKKLTQSHLIYVEKQDSSLDRMIIRGKGDLPEENCLHATVYQNRSGAIFSFFLSYKENFSPPSSFNLPVIENLDQPTGELVNFPRASARGFYIKKNINSTPPKPAFSRKLSGFGEARPSPFIPAIPGGAFWRRRVKKLEQKLGQGNTIILQHGGILSFGCTADHAGEQLLSVISELSVLRKFVD